jgi:hypothetical protein
MSSSLEDGHSASVSAMGSIDEQVVMPDCHVDPLSLAEQLKGKGRSAAR